MYLIWLAGCQESFRQGPVEDVGVSRQSMSMHAVFGEAGVAFSRPEEDAIVLSFRGWGFGEAEVLGMPAVEDDGAFVRYQFSGVEEWWTAESGGIRQGWTVSDWPAGDGELVFDVAVAGAEVEVWPDRAVLTGEIGPAWHYSGPKAWDARGKVLEAWLEAGDGGVRVVVDVDGAELPVTVDPLMTTASWEAEGTQTNEFFGQAVSSAGDVNGDGYSDVLVGAGNYNDGSTQDGRANIYHGSAGGLQTSAATTMRPGEATPGYSEGYGESVASAGDVNGDGYGDVVVGAPNFANGQQGEGRAFVYLGSASGIVTSASWTGESGQVSAHFGHSVASAGDTNGDGYGDLVVGAYEYDNGSSNEGRAYLYLGAPSGLGTSPSWVAEPDEYTVRFGNAVASAGDVNGDGYGDVVVGAYNAVYGRAYLYLGSASGLAATASWIVESDGVSSYFGQSVASAGDVNGDGFGDVVVGAPYYVTGLGTVGRAFVYLGSAAGLATTPAWTAEADKHGASFGYSVASAGDVNGDGYGDVVVGASGYSNGSTSEGRAYTYLGSAAGLTTSAAWTVESDQAGAILGNSVASAGDVNDDGYGDVLIGAVYYDNAWMGAGKAYVFHGAADFCYQDLDGDHFGDGSLPTIAATTLDCTNAGESPYATDCDDSDGAIYPNAVEITADAVDQDCDGGDSCFADTDADGHGTDAILASANLDCSDTGESTMSDDCDGTETSIHPDAPEVPADGVDQDCDGGDTCFADADGDADGTAAAIASADLTCEAPGESATSTDCDDAAGDVYFGAPEVPSDGIDQDCSGGDRCYADSDSDGHGSTFTLESADLDCDDPEESGVADDCNDTIPAISPSTPEITADGLDQDCDGYDNCYADLDGDNFGSSTLVITTNLSCSDDGEAPDSGDCDDSEAAIKPGATETAADGVDQNCDSQELCYADTDGDGFGSTTTVVSADLDCTASGESAQNTDCDASAPEAYPGAPEIPANATDESCDDRELCYFDEDRDGFGGDTTFESFDLDCTDSFESILATDCDDASASVFPTATEITADGIDQNCDGGDTCHIDFDGDTFGITDTLSSPDLSCSDAGESPISTDCNDNSITEYPGAPEITANLTDEDCDGWEVCYLDNDGDGFATEATTLGEILCAIPTTDCDDENVAIHPDATEVPADNVDQNCDGEELCYVDSDGDNFGTPTTQTGTLGCDEPSTDCDDANPNVNPNTAETTADGLDQNCDGIDNCYQDADHDGYGSATLVETTDLDCADLGEANNADDCDDSATRTRPGATETPANGTDENCDGLELCYVDADGDGAGGETTETGHLSCVIANTDCNDADGSVLPGATETCNGVDDNCNGDVDDGLNCAEDIPLCGCDAPGTPAGGAGIALAAMAALTLRARRFRANTGT